MKLYAPILQFVVDSLSLFPIENEFPKSVNIWWSYCKNSTPRSLYGTVYIYRQERIDYILEFICLWIRDCNPGIRCPKISEGVSNIAMRDRTFFHNLSYISGKKL